MASCNLLESKFICKWYQFIFPVQSIKRAAWSIIIMAIGVLILKYFMDNSEAVRASMIGGCIGVFALFYIVLPMRLIIKARNVMYISRNVVDRIGNMGFMLIHESDGMDVYQHKGPRIFWTKENAVKI